MSKYTNTGKQVKSLSERVTNLEEHLAKLLFGLNQRFQGVDQRLATVEEIADAVMDLQGRNEVERQMDESRVVRARELAAFEKAKLEQGIADGYVVQAEKVGEKSIVIGKYVDTAGNVIEPGRAQLVMPGIAPQFREKLLGQTAGVVLDLPDGGKFVLDAAYDVDEKKALEVQAAKAAAATEQAGETAASDEAADKAGA
jgi:hypothetical protein